MYHRSVGGIDWYDLFNLIKKHIYSELKSTVIFIVK